MEVQAIPPPTHPPNQTNSVCPRQNASMLYAFGYLLTRIFSSRSQVITWLLLKDRTYKG